MRALPRRGGSQPANSHGAPPCAVKEVNELAPKAAKKAPAKKAAKKAPAKKAPAKKAKKK